MKKTLTKRRGGIVLSVVLVVALLVGTVGSFADTGVPSNHTRTLYQKYDIAPGIVEEDITSINDATNNQTKSFAATIDSTDSSVGIVASYMNYDNSGTWGMQSVRDQAKAFEKKTGKKVVFAINADYFNMNNGAPLGALVMQGVEVNSPLGEPAYFGIKNDAKKTPVIRDSSTSVSDISEAVGSPIWLLREGEIQVGDDAAYMPRAAVGIKENGDVVFFESDGRQAPKSVGLSLYETADYMKSLGCVNALYLDGGGSATFCSKRAGEDSLTVKNSPSDGNERKVSSAILVYSDAKADGTFHKAVLGPQNEVYTPGSEVQMTATGVDSAGTKVDLPAGAEFVLADGSFGTIDPKSGLFTSNGKAGQVDVNMMYEGKVVGSTLIQIQKPDKIVFANEEVSLDFGDTSNLGMMATYKNQEVNFKDGDFEWTITDKTDINGDPTDREAGSFDGNIFTATKEKKTIFAKATCTVKGTSVSATVGLSIGVQPTVVMDFEDRQDAEGNKIPAKDYWTFNDDTTIVYNANGGIERAYRDDDPKHENELLSQGYKIPSLMITGNYDRGSKGKSEVVDIASGYPVRMGNHSLKVNYDFTNMATKEIVENGKTYTVGNATEGACIGFTNGTTITGNPTAIGMYVYAPEGTPDFWLRMRFLDGTGTTQTVDFAAGSKTGGIDWNGWKYCEAKLSTEGGDPVPGPYTLIPGETIRVLYVAATSNGFHDKDGNVVPISQCKGSIYIDNLQFVYGSNTTDTQEPNIPEMRANGEAITDATEVNGINGINFELTANDIHEGYKYDRGVDFDTANVYIDGRNVTTKEIEKGNLMTDPSKDAVFLYNQKLTPGEHSIKLAIRDEEGNEATATREFVVVEEVGSELTIPSFNISPVDNYALLGEDAKLQIKTKDLSFVKNVTASINLSAGFSDYEVEYADGFEEGAAPVFDADSNTVTINAVRKADAEVQGSGAVATLSVKVPVSTPEDAVFAYKVTMGEATIANGEEEVITSFASKRKTLDITAKYSLNIPTFVTGEQNAIVIKNADGTAAPKISLYNAEGDVKLGTSDTKGKVKLLFNEPQKLTIYACDADGVRSFNKSVLVYPVAGNEDGTPSFISLNSSKSGATAKNITWISDPTLSDTAIAQVALKSAYDNEGAEAFKDYEGTVKKLTFTASQTSAAANNVVNANAVEVTGLNEGAEYVYRVGDGEIWSPVYSFKTKFKNSDTSFFIVGDTQADDVTTISNIVKAIGTNDVDFGIQTGDFVEAPNIFANWEKIMGAFGDESIKSTDMIHVTGNHEHEGDNGASIATRLFNIENNKRYSVEYGNVYVAVLGFDSTEAGAKADAEWLVQDAAKSDATWKIVTSHQPAYGTNAEDSGSTYISQYVTAACEEAGIDIMFSGHDHSYARTEKVKGGVADPDGINYCICGSTGEKSYTVSTSKYKDFKFDIATREGYDGLYMVVKTTDEKFSIVAYDQDGNIFDTYELEKTSKTCENDSHVYSIDENGRLVCDKCGYSREIGDYTGLVTDEETGVKVNLVKGEPTKNQWVMSGDDSYYMGSDGYALTGKQTIKNDNGTPVEYTFDETGKYVSGSFVKETVTDENGVKEEITRYYEAGGAYAIHWREIDGEMYYFKKTSNKETYDMGKMYTGDGVTKQLVKTVANNNNRYYVFNEDGTLEVGAFWTYKDNGKTRYFWGDEYNTEPQLEIQGVVYNFDEEGFIITKDITECDVDLSKTEFVYSGKKNIPAPTVTDGELTLAKGDNYTVKYEDNVEIGKAKAIITGKIGYSGTVEKTFKIKPTQVHNVSAARASYSSIKLSWSEFTDVADGIRIYRATSENGTYKYIKEINDFSTTEYTNTGLTCGKTYYYKVKAYKIAKDGLRYVSKNATIVSAKPTLSKATIKSISSPKANAAKLTWNKIAGATGYKVYRASSKDGTYKLVKTIKSGSTLTYTNSSKSNLKSGKRYYYKVRAYRVVNEKNVYGKYSGYKSVVID